MSAPKMPDVRTVTVWRDQGKPVRIEGEAGGDLTVYVFRDSFSEHIAELRSRPGGRRRARQYRKRAMKKLGTYYKIGGGSG